MGSALDARGVASAENLSAQVAGEIADVEGVLRITAIRLHFTASIPRDLETRVKALLNSFASKCPAYMSVRECIDCSWTADFTLE